MARMNSALFYRDPRAALDWLQKAFGFELSMLLEDAEGNVAHSQLTLGDGTIMVGGEWSAFHQSPASLGGINSQTVHIQIDTDIDAHCARAHEHGAQIIEPPTTQFYGDRTYRCRDLEGHIWTVSQPVRAVTREQAEVAGGGLKITGWI